MMLRFFLLLMLALNGCVIQASDDRCAVATWSDWATFQQMMLSEQGRVIDASDPRQITTSEGQSYAMFFALVNNEPLLFRRLVRWTEDHLAQGDLTAHLPAWLWGQKPDNTWGVLDSNTASDSNLWIAYTLLEAGRLWHERSYSVQGHLMLKRMAQEEVLDIPDFGYVLMPGQYGFSGEHSWRLNPSYVPPQLLARIAQEQPIHPWAELLENTPRFLLETSPLGLAPDWVTRTQKDWSYQRADEKVGSYDAIRVYLWIGMLHPDSLHSSALKAHFKQGLLSLQPQILPAEKIAILQGTAEGLGPAGFSAALLPLLSDTPSAALQRQRIQYTPMHTLGYYNQALMLFGQGWDDKRYFFDQHGYLVPVWVDCNE